MALVNHHQSVERKYVSETSSFEANFGTLIIAHDTANEPQFQYHTVLHREAREKKIQGFQKTVNMSSPSLTVATEVSAYIDRSSLEMRHESLVVKRPHRSLQPRHAVVSSQLVDIGKVKNAGGPTFGPVVSKFFKNLSTFTSQSVKTSMRQVNHPRTFGVCVIA